MVAMKTLPSQRPFKATIKVLKVEDLPDNARHIHVEILSRQFHPRDYMLRACIRHELLLAHMDYNVRIHHDYGRFRIFRYKRLKSRGPSRWQYVDRYSYEVNSPFNAILR